LRRIQVEGYETRLEHAPVDDPERFRWISPADPVPLPVSSMTRKLLAGFAARQIPLALE